MSHDLERMVAVQAQHISRLNAEAREQMKTITRLEAQARRYKTSHDYYMSMQKACMESDAVMSAFQSFMAILTLATNEKVAGLTKPDDRIAKYDDFGPWPIDPEECR